MPSVRGAYGVPSEATSSVRRASVEGSAGLSRLQYAEAGGLSHEPAIPAQRGQQAGLVDSLRSGKIAGNHRAVEGYEAQLVQQPRLQTRHVGMGKERLGMLPHQPEVEAAKQIIASVTSTATKYGAAAGSRKAACRSSSLACAVPAK